MYQHELTKLQLANEMIDFINPKNDIPTENMRFLRPMRLMVNENYQILLPLKDVNVNFFNNRKQILWRLQSLQKTFERNSKICEDYQYFMGNMIKNEYTEESTAEAKEGKTWYLTIHRNLQKLE